MIALMTSSMTVLMAGAVCHAPIHVLMDVSTTSNVGLAKIMIVWYVGVQRTVMSAA